MQCLLTDRLLELGEAARARRKQYEAEHGDDVICDVTLSQAMRGLGSVPNKRPGAKVLISHALGETFVDPDLGWHLAGRPIGELARDRFEANYWRMLVGEDPDDEQVENLQVRFAGLRTEFIASPQWTAVRSVLNAMLSTLEHEHVDPMDTLAMAVGCLGTMQRTSAARGGRRINQETAIDLIEDILMLQAVLPVIAGFILCKLSGRTTVEDDPMLMAGYSDSFANYCKVADDDLDAATLVLDQLLTLMMHHGPGNVSTHSAKTASSGRNTPVQTAYNMIGALAGANHGGAADWALDQLFQIRDTLGVKASTDALTQLAKARLNPTDRQPKEPIWAVGHRILRGANDPRQVAMLEMLEDLFDDNAFFQMAMRWYKAAAPVVASDTGAEFCAVNVDGLSGLAAHLAGVIPDGMSKFAPCIFAVSRWAGVGAEMYGLALNRALFRPSTHHIPGF